MMNKLLLFTTLATLPFVAQAADINYNTARMQAMDKITGHVSEIDVPVNGLANFGTFSILVRKCVGKSPEETPENTAFVDVVDNYKSENPINIFKGWMFSSTPALNAVEHPIYDIWLLKCYNNKQSANTTLSEEQLAKRDALPQQHPEPIKVITNISSVEETSEVPLDNTKEIEPDSEKSEIVSINVTNDEPTAEQADTSPDEDFVSEGEEENIVDDSIIPDETLATNSNSDSVSTDPDNTDETIVVTNETIVVED